MLNIEIAIVYLTLGFAFAVFKHFDMRSAEPDYTPGFMTFNFLSNWWCWLPMITASFIGLAVEWLHRRL